MTKEQKRNIRILGKDNYSININILEKASIISDREDELDGKLYTFCTNCNKKIEQKIWGAKENIVVINIGIHNCNKNSKRDLYDLVCEYCGKKYKALSMKRKYCSHNCYIRNKYWRKEDTEGIMNKILAGDKVESIPKWLKKLL